ncbi:MAG: VCBS repeat-containing protein [Aquificae bacterium]|nr:VCBS repeat-containing protein [Aquificota bacterium]
MGFLICVLLFFSVLVGFSSATEPLNKRVLIENLEIVVGDASEDGISIFDFSGYLRKVGTKELYYKYDGEDKITGGRFFGSVVPKLVMGFGKERNRRKLKRISGHIVVFSLRNLRPLKSFDVDFSELDQLVAGNVYPDRYFDDEIIVGSADRDTVEVYNGSGRLLASINVDFQRYDRLSAGDVDGDGLDEIVMGDASADQIRIFKYQNGRLVEINSFLGEGLFEREDRVAVGDVDGDNVEEIIFVNKNGDTYLYNLEGNLLTRKFRIKYDESSYVVAGDVNNDGKAEIVVAYADDDRIHIYDMFGSELASINAGIEGKDKITLIDVDFDSLVVGKPKPPATITVDNQVIATINEPPKEKSLLGEKATGILYASYKNREGRYTEQKVKATHDVLVSTGISSSQKADIKLLAVSMKEKINYEVGYQLSKSQGNRLEITIGSDMNADGYEDRAISLTTTYMLYEYPILSPRNMAVVNGKRQYVLVSVPVGIDTYHLSIIYKSNKHVNGFVASYPERKRELYHYSSDNEIASWELDIGCSSSSVFFSRKETQTQIKESKVSHAISLSVEGAAEVSKMVSVSGSISGKYAYSKLKTHTISFDNSTYVSVWYAGGMEGCNEADKRYTIGAVLYYDSEDGHLVLDYYVPRKGSFYKPPPVVPPYKPMLLDKYGRPIKPKVLIPRNLLKMERVKPSF